MGWKQKPSLCWQGISKCIGSASMVPATQDDDSNVSVVQRLRRRGQGPQGRGRGRGAGAPHLLGVACLLVPRCR